MLWTKKKISAILLLKDVPFELIQFIFNMKFGNRLFLSFIFLIFCAFQISGCAQNQQTIARLEQENAQQRERIWQSNRKMEDFRQENESLRQQLAVLQGKNRAGNSSASYSTGTVRANAAVQPLAQSSLNGRSSNAVSPSTPGAVETRPTNSSMNIAPQPPTATLGVPSSLENQTVYPPSGSKISIGNTGKTLRVRKTDSKNVHSIAILPQKARKIDTRGLHAEFQMKDSAGDVVLAAAPISVMVTDPSLPENQSRISEWKYSAEDIADVINSGQAAIAIPLNMEWANACPQNPNLELHILYYTSDKRILMHRAKIDLNVRSASGSASVASSAYSGAFIPGTSNPPVGTNADLPSSAKTFSKPEWSPTP